MNFPPTKRLRGLNHNVARVVPFDDPFGDDDGFTQDDLDEIDIIASQAINSAAAETELSSKPQSKLEESPWHFSAGQSKSLSRDTDSQSSGDTLGVSSSNRRDAGAPNREPLVRSRQQQQFGSDIKDSYLHLEAHHAELKRKLKEVEDEIALKNGEIRVLRDSLKSAQQEKEAQRQSQLQLETHRQKEQSDIEKELNKKVQSLQSELQFKDAEIHEMKTKLHSSDKNKTTTPLNRNSPKVSSSIVQSHSGSGGSTSSPAGKGFITNETFRAQVPHRTKTRRDERTGSNSRSGDSIGEVLRSDPFVCVQPAHLHHRGGVLLGLLLQQPLSRSSLSLSHLLHMMLTDISPTSSGQSSGFLPHPNAPEGCKVDGPSRAALSLVQSLGVTGLNMLSQCRTAAASSNRSCPGAVLLLPLLNLQLIRLCQCLDSFHSNSTGSDGSSSAPGTVLPLGLAGSPAGQGQVEKVVSSRLSMEEIGLASLRLLQLLLVHSDEVVKTVLSDGSQSRTIDEKMEQSAAGMDLCSQNSMFQSVLRLCDVGSGSGSSRKEMLVVSAMKTLYVLIENMPETHTEGLQCVLQVICAHLSADTRLQTVSEWVSFLMLLSDSKMLVQQLFSVQDPCVLLRLFLYIRIRPDNQAAQTGWIQLDLKVIRLLNRLVTQGTETWTKHVHSNCKCHTELVQTVVIVLHRQWLELRDSQEPTDLTGSPSKTPQGSGPLLPKWHSAAVSLLRECVLLLHWLLLHHSSFSESCRPLLHMYDQVIPAVRDTLKKIPGLSESEELALEEICRSEGDETDDMETND